MKFNCTQCGLCCSAVGHVINKAKEEVRNGSTNSVTIAAASFPHQYDPLTGRCEMLNEDNSCKVYETRPEMCNVKLMHKNHFAATMSRKDFYKLNEAACAMLQAEDRIRKRLSDDH